MRNSNIFKQYYEDNENIEKLVRLFKNGTQQQAYCRCFLSHNPAVSPKQVMTNLNLIFQSKNYSVKCLQVTRKPRKYLQNPDDFKMDYIQIEGFCQNFIEGMQSQTYNYAQNQYRDNVFTIMCFGPRTELFNLHNLEVPFISDSFQIVYLHTVDRYKDDLMIDTRYFGQAKRIYQMKYADSKLQKLSFGILNSSDNIFFDIFNQVEVKKQGNNNYFGQFSAQDEILLDVIFDQRDEVDKKESIIAFVLTAKDFSMKVEFQMMNVAKIFCVKGKEYYFQFTITPKIFVRKTSGVCNTEHIAQKQYGWTRVENFIALNIEKRMNELLRIEYANNTVIAFEFQENSKFQDEFLKQMKKHELRGTCELIQLDQPFYTIPLWPTSFSLLDFSSQLELLSNLSFDLRYSIYALISKNKLSVFVLESFLNIIMKHLLDGTSEFVISKTIEQLYFQKANLRFECVKSLDNLIEVQKQQEPQQLKVFRSFEKNTNVIATRKVVITPSGVFYQMKEFEQTNRLMRIFRAQIDQFIRGSFADDSQEPPKSMEYISGRYFRKTLACVKILGQSFNNFGWSSSQLRQNSTWYFSDTNELTKTQVRNRIGNFSGIHPPAKKAARIGQCFSTSTPFLFKERPNIIIIDDIKTPDFKMRKIPFTQEDEIIFKKSKAFTDGIGMISKDLMNLIKTQLKDQCLTAIQVRFGGAKGVLTVKEDSEQVNTITLRKSMMKYSITNRDDELQIDILTRNKFREGQLNRQIIILLSSLGVPDSRFILAQEEHIQRLIQSTLKFEDSFDLFNSGYGKDNVQVSPVTQLLRRINAAKIDILRDEFCQGITQTLKKRGFYFLRKKSNIYLNKSARLIGVIDEYCLLKENEVFLYISRDDNRTFQNIVANAFVTKNPCLDPGDIRKVRAVSLEEIALRLPEGVVVNPFESLRNVLVFPQVGEVPLTAQTAGSDLDGDCYFVCWDERFIPPQESEPFDYDQDEVTSAFPRREPYPEAKDIPFFTDSQFNEDPDDERMLDFFIDYMNNDKLGIIANKHLALADQCKKHALDPVCKIFAALHSQAVDYPKTGKLPIVPKEPSINEYPDFMESSYYPSYESHSVLGRLYREVKDQYVMFCSKEDNSKKNVAIYITEKVLIKEEFHMRDDHFLNVEVENAIDRNANWNEEISRIQHTFGTANEFEIYSGNFSKLCRVDGKKKLNHRQAQKRIDTQLFALKSKYEIAFFSSLPESDKVNFDRKGRWQEYSKECLMKASIWFIVSGLKNQQTLDALDFGEGTFCKAVVDKFVQKQRGGNKKLFHEKIGLAWYIIGDILLEIKRQNDQKEEENKQIDQIQQIRLEESRLNQRQIVPFDDINEIMYEDDFINQGYNYHGHYETDSDGGDSDESDWNPYG